jgi:hypothetical protein
MEMHSSSRKFNIRKPVLSFRGPPEGGIEEGESPSRLCNAKLPEMQSWLASPAPNAIRSRFADLLSAARAA